MGMRVHIPAASEYLPTSHALHAYEPAAPLYLPIMHAVHVPMAPVCPGPHCGEHYATG